MTPQNIFPTFRYEDAKAAIAWLRDTVGFEELSIHEGDGGTIEHAELAIAGNVIMLGSARSETEDRFATSRCVDLRDDRRRRRALRARAAGARCQRRLAGRR
jgi:uncharacterized glyoxalase superfamily protein PhnB